MEQQEKSASKMRRDGESWGVTFYSSFSVEIVPCGLLFCLVPRIDAEWLLFAGSRSTVESLSSLLINVNFDEGGLC